MGVGGREGNEGGEGGNEGGGKEGPDDMKDNYRLKMGFKNRK